jgi:dCMP deaminase
MCNHCLKEHATKIKKARNHLRQIPRFTIQERSWLNESESFLKQHLMDRVFISNAINLSHMSHCVSRQVGCVIALDGRTLVTGVNGTSRGDVNCDELFPAEGFDPAAHRKWSDDNEIHAELNAINFAAKHGISLDGATLYCSLQPCMQCSKNLPAVGIKRIVFGTFYDRVDNFQDQVEYLSRKGVIIEQLMDEASLNARLDQILSFGENR